MGFRKGFCFALLASFVLAGCASHHGTSARLNKKERLKASAIQAAGEEGGWAARRAGVTNYPDLVAKAVEHGREKPDLLLPVFSASIGVDGAAASGQELILGTTLYFAGDQSFAAALENAPLSAKWASALLLCDSFLFGLDWDGSIRLKAADYPKTYAMVAGMRRGNH